MVSDSINNHNNGSLPRDRKKKRANRSAKLKQCKLDARREQWLSQGTNVKGKGGKEELVCVGLLPVPGNDCEERKILESLEGGRKGRGGGLVVTHVEEEEEENDNGACSDLSSNSPSGSSVLGGSDCGMNFTGSPSSSSSSGSSSCGGCYSGNITEEEGGGEDNCLDDWEAVADALAAADDHQRQGIDSAVEAEVSRSSQQRVQDGLDLNSNAGKKGNVRAEPPRWATGSSTAWRPDDVFRPQNLPTLSKQLSFTFGDQHYPLGGRSSWAHQNTVNVPSSCPICCEELDWTDTSFLPCLCGFRLCLFCHKRILEEDGRCPGCRKPYERGLVEAKASVHEDSLTLRLPRSCSFNTRS